jgi:hypothetical protein
MSSSEGPKAQKRHIDVHAQFGRAHIRVNFPRSNDIDLKSTYPTPRRIDNQPPVPTAETLPVPESTPYTHREGVHVTHDYQPTLWRMSHAFVGKSQPDAIPVNPTRVTGKENRRGWKTPKATRKTATVRRKADKWIAKHGAKV